MIQAIILLNSIVCAFLGHHFAEAKVTNGWKKDVQIVVGKYHIHHSFFGVVFLILSLTLASGFMALILAGYGIGNLWQHKYTHNKQGEKGMVFVTKIKA